MKKSPMSVKHASNLTRQCTPIGYLIFMFSFIFACSLNAVSGDIKLVNRLTYSRRSIFEESFTDFRRHVGAQWAESLIPVCSNKTENIHAFEFVCGSKWLSSHEYLPAYEIFLALRESRTRQPLLADSLCWLASGNTSYSDSNITYTLSGRPLSKNLAWLTHTAVGAIRVAGRVHITQTHTWAWSKFVECEERTMDCFFELPKFIKSHYSSSERISSKLMRNTHGVSCAGKLVKSLIGLKDGDRRLSYGSLLLHSIIQRVIFSPSELVRSHMLKEARTWNQKLAHSALDSPLVSLASILGLRDEHDAILP